VGDRQGHAERDGRAVVCAGGGEGGVSL
jgi:hypothetical protein